MKKFACVFLFLALFGVTSGIYAHSYVALHKATGVSLFSGSLAFRQAYEAASPGDTIYLPGGTFQAPDTIAKKIYVIGVGHYPSHTQATNITYVTGPVRLNALATQSYFEGIHFNNIIAFIENEAVSNVMFRRCRIDGHIAYYGDNANPKCVNNQYIECLILGEAYYITCNNAVDLIFSNCIFLFNGFQNLKSSLIANSIFIKSGGFLIYDSNNSIFRNNIIRNGLLWRGSGNIIHNNIFPYIPSYYGPNNEYNNYTNIDIAELFENFAVANFFSYDFDFHLKNPSEYIGSDGTQVGIYGGSYPYKDGAVPFNPHVESKNISGAIDADGKVRVEIRVSAQQQ